MNGVPRGELPPKVSNFLGAVHQLPHPFYLRHNLPFMDLDKMRAEAYGHLLLECTDVFYRQIVLAHFALEELKLPNDEAIFYTRNVLIMNESEINSPEFDRFYMWYYINYIVKMGIKS